MVVLRLHSAVANPHSALRVREILLRSYVPGAPDTHGLSVKDWKAGQRYRSQRGGKEAEQHRRCSQLVGEGRRRMLAHARQAARPPRWRRLEWQGFLVGAVNLAGMDRAEAEAIYQSGREACVEFILDLAGRFARREDR